MKVTFLTYNLDPRGGWGRLVHETTTRLSQRGVEIKILSETPSSFPGESVVLKRGWHIIESISKVRKFLKNVDIIHSWEGNPYAITSFLAGLGLGKRQIITATGAYSVQPLYRPVVKFILARAYKNAEVVICISKYIKSEIDRLVPGVNTIVITPGVDFEKFSGKRFAPQERFILGVGNLGRRKGYHISIPAFGKIASQVPDIKYYIAGRLDKNFHQRALELMREYDVVDRVVFLGSLNDDELKKLYLSAELFILTSINYKHHFEGFGLVFLEAASAGLPVIGTRDNGIGDAMAENRNGLLVEQNDIEGTAEAMLKILKDHNLKERFSNESVKFAKENSWDNMVNKYMESYGRGQD